MRLLLMLAALAAPIPALAQDAFAVPPGCEAFLTVQSRGCTVAHYWTCEADPEGIFWRISLDQDGPFWLSQSDEEYRWLQSYDLRSDGQGVLLEPEEDPASVTELLETGTDTMDFTILRQEGGVEFERSYAGFDRLTGAEVEIDGERLLLTEFAYEYDAEGGQRRTSGNQFLSADRRLFFGGLETVTLPSGESFEGDYSPREFHEPGDEGFLATRPIYDCGDVMSALPRLPGTRG